MKKGDKFVHFTKYGGTVIGEVESINNTIIVSPRLGIRYKEEYLKSTNGVLYPRNECFLIHSTMTEKEIEGHEKFRKWMEEDKDRRTEKMLFIKNKYSK